MVHGCLEIAISNKNKEIFVDRTRGQQEGSNKKTTFLTYDLLPNRILTRSSISLAQTGILSPLPVAGKPHLHTFFFFSLKSK